jgi:hypothetical protein
MAGNLSVLKDLRQSSIVLLCLPWVSTTLNPLKR